MMDYHKIGYPYPYLGAGGWLKYDSVGKICLKTVLSVIFLRKISIFLELQKKLL